MSFNQWTGLWYYWSLLYSIKDPQSDEMSMEGSKKEDFREYKRVDFS